MIQATEVAIFHGEPRYPMSPPFHPSDAFPEYPFGGAVCEGGYATAAAGAGRDPVRATETNHVYRAVRGALQLLGLDRAAFDTARWNPLGEIIRPGETVVLKPNFVRDFRETNADHGDCLITHGAVIRAVLDYVYIALGGNGRIVIADAPQNDASFQAIRRIAGLDAMQAFYRRQAGFSVEVYDLRPECAHKVDGVIVGHSPLPGDPVGYARVNLGLHSAFAEVNHLCHLLYGAEYDTGELLSHHHGDVHEYLISKTVLNADCVISLPKLKTHKKVGLTVNMKNLVGINGNKNWLPHHREGTPTRGGDQFPEDGVKRRIERATVMQFKRLFPVLGPLRPLVARPAKAVGKRVFGDTNKGTIRSGNWYGNDTTWRMVIDLNRILFYADAAGELRDRPVRRFFSIVDGIIAGEGNGPLDPTPKPTGLVLAGRNPVAVDLACARLMWFDHRRLPVLYRALADHPMPLVSFGFEDIVAYSNREGFAGPIARLCVPGLAFEPHFGWKGHVEVAVQPDEASPVA